MRARLLESRPRELERARVDDLRGCVDLPEQRGDVDAPMGRRVRAEPALGFLELPLAADSVATAGLVPGHGYVDEALEEVAFHLFGCPPRVFELLVGGKVLAGSNQLESALESPGLRLRP